MWHFAPSARYPSAWLLHIYPLNEEEKVKGKFLRVVTSSQADAHLISPFSSLRYHSFALVLCTVALSKAKAPLQMHYEQRIYSPIIRESYLRYLNVAHAAAHLSQREVDAVYHLDGAHRLQAHTPEKQLSGALAGNTALCAGYQLYRFSVTAVAERTSHPRISHNISYVTSGHWLRRWNLRWILQIAFQKKIKENSENKEPHWEVIRKEAAHTSPTGYLVYLVFVFFKRIYCEWKHLPIGRQIKRTRACYSYPLNILFMVQSPFKFTWIFGRLVWADTASQFFSFCSFWQQVKLWELLEVRENNVLKICYFVGTS